MSATNFCESSSFIVKNEVEVFVCFRRLYVQFCVYIIIKIKRRVKVLNVSCKSTCFDDIKGFANLLKNGEK